MSIKVLIVDDSATAREIIKTALSKDKEIQVIGTAPDAFIARDMIVKLCPDVICLDVEMPRMDGITFLKKIMTYLPTPVIMVSSLTQKGAQTTLDALSFGAFDYVAKGHSNIYDGDDRFEKELISKVKSASKININLLKMRMQNNKKASPKTDYVLKETTKKIVAIGSSTGGTVALQELLCDLPRNFPGIVIVQHMPGTFTNSFATRLNGLCNIDVKEAKDGDIIQMGKALLANGSYHIKIIQKGGNYYVKYYEGDLVSGHKPSVDVLFNSAAKSAGKNAIGIILTGMGKDGAKGMLAMKNAGAKTIAQDEKTSVVYGMPKAAFELGATDYVLPLDKIGSKTISILKQG